MNKLLPNIYLYNPTCEYSIANGSANWQPNQILQKMESDLSALPMFFAKENDYVLVDKIPSQEFIALLKKIYINFPNFILKNDALKNQDFITLSKNKLLPWGWSPSMHKFLSPFKKSCSIHFEQSPVFNWQAEHREISSRKFALELLQQLQSNIKTDFIIPLELQPKICITKKEFETAIQKWGTVMIKAPWSSSGRGLQPITKTPVHQKVWEKIMGVVKEQGYAIAEPYLNKVLDVALLFELKKGKVKYLGTSNFSTNKNGQYQGNYLNGWPVSIEKKVLDFADFIIPIIREPITEVIETSIMATHYEGVFGIDTLIYSDEENSLRINPCLEINVRHTMGLLSLRLETLINKNKKGMFSTYFQPGKSFYTFSKEMNKKYPLKILGNKIDSGFLALTEPANNSLFGAYILV